MRGFGTLVNAGAVLLGGGLGLLLKKGIPQRVSDAVMKALGLVVLYLGLSGAWDMEKPLVTIVSLAIGTAVGTALKLDDRVGALAQKLTGRLGKGEWKDGMVTATLLFCVGAMGITGALTDGLTGDHSILFTKAFLDGISACFLASAMGAGVLLSAGALLAYQGLFTLLGVFFSAFFAQAAGAMGAVGSLLLVPIAFNMMGLGKFRVMEYVPAVFMPLILYWIL